MPIYEYACTACDHRTDILHGINDPGPTFCPSCGAEGTMRKLFAPPTIHFKGSGWAKKDRGGSSAGGTKSSSGGTPETKSEGGSTGSSTEGSGSASGSSGESGSGSSGSKATGSAKTTGTASSSGSGGD